MGRDRPVPGTVLSCTQDCEHARLIIHHANHHPLHLRETEKTQLQIASIRAIVPPRLQLNPLKLQFSKQHSLTHTAMVPPAPRAGPACRGGQVALC